MIDIKDLRERPEIYKENTKKRGKNIAIIDRILKIDGQWRKAKVRADSLRAERNKVSKSINQYKKQGKDVTTLIKKAKELPEQIRKAEEDEALSFNQLNKEIYSIPNLMHPNVPFGKTDKDNVEVKKIGKPLKFNFPVKTHQELGKHLDILDFETSASTSGNGFYVLKGDLALLNQALIRFVIDKMISKDYVYIETPLMLREDVIKNVTDLNDMVNQIYKVEGGDLYLIGTSEHSMIGRYIQQTIPEDELPIKNTSYSMCFRREIGSHGIDEKGLYRTHQFNKVEMIIICKNDVKESMKYFEEAKEIAVEVFKDLGIPIRILEICSGDLGNLKYRQVDIEAWSPKLKDYYEVGSCSNLTDAQARKLGIRVVTRRAERYTPHTLNNTAIATSRALIAILENYQQKDGSVKIPKVLWKYMNGKKTIEIKKEKKMKKDVKEKTKVKKGGK